MSTKVRNVAVIVTSLHSGDTEKIAGLLSKELEKYYNVYLFLLNTEDIVYEYGGIIVEIGHSGSLYEYDIDINKKKYHIDCAISFLDSMNFANIRTRGTERVLLFERSVQSLISSPFTAQTLKIQRYYDYADAIIACSEGIKFDLVHNYGVHGGITTIYDFIDKEDIISRSHEDLPYEVRNFLNGAEFFVNVERLCTQKNQKRLIRQFSYFHAVNQTVKLLILGSGKLETELALYIAELGLEKSVKVILNPLNPFMYVARAKALILPRHYEGLPNAVLEAMTLECPVIAIDCLAGSRELLMDEPDYGKALGKLEVCRRGILVSNDSTEDDGITRYMSKAMELLCSSASMIEDFRQNEQKYMEQYNNQRIVDKWRMAIEGSGRKEDTNVLIKEENILNEAKHIVIYGVGVVGRSIFLRLSKRHKIDCFVVTRRKEGEREFLGIPIEEISKLKYSPNDTAVIIGVGSNGNNQDELVNTLQERGFARIVFPFIEPLSYEYYLNCEKLDVKSELQDWYRMCTGRDIDIDHPNTFNEKIQWLKLYDNRPIKTELADKYAVRRYVAEKIGDKYLIPLLGIWNSFEAIDFSKLPDQFVLKCTHGSGMNMIVKNKSKVDYKAAKRKFDQWMDMDYSYKAGFETHYAGIVPKILAEKMLESEDGGDLRDYKVFVFHGKAKLIQVDIDRQHTHKRNLYTPEWEYVPCSICYPTAPNIIVDKPVCLDELIRLSEILGEGFIHVRADFYIWKEQIFFGELTFTHGSGTEAFEPEEYGREMGSWMELTKWE